MKNKIKAFCYYTLGFLALFINLSFKVPHPSNKLNNSVTAEVEPHFFSKENIKDGPYIFINNNHVSVKWIYKNRLSERYIFGKNFKVIKKKFGFDFDPKWIEDSEKEVANYVQRYENISKVIALSDIHGQYDVLASLLKKYKVIDNQFNWSYGNGHLVVLGDIMDRGPKVTESLWLIYRLEKQAEKAGGKVHVLLGNHEVMVLNNDARYINEKYIKTARLMSTTYDELYSENTLLGRWLRKKPVMVTINDMLFVHAGVSVDFITKGQTRSGTNKIFNEKIVGSSWKTILEDPTLSFMMSDKGPIWYRGYFEQPKVKEYQVTHILNYFGINHIIVGHTSMPNIVSLYGKKIFGIDSSIQYGDYGEVFIYQNEEYYRGTFNGNLIKF